MIVVGAVNIAVVLSIQCHTYLRVSCDHHKHVFMYIHNNNNNNNNNNFFF